MSKRRMQCVCARSSSSLALAVVAAACGGGRHAQDAATTKPRPKKVATAATPTVVPVAPLTGLPDPTGVVAQAARRSR